MYIKSMSFTVALTVQFSHLTFSGNEKSGVLHANLLIEGGTSVNNITVTVIPSDQLPLSAEGKISAPYVH